MQQGKNSRKNIIIAVISWALVFICMGIIFWLSSRTADESDAQSSVILKWFIDNFGDNFFTSFIVRKLAHFSEYTGLCLLTCNALYKSAKRCKVQTGIVIASIYAASDEFHQRFVEGRSCELRDWAIDTCGAILGALIFLTIYAIVKKIMKKKNKVDTQIN